MAIKEQQNDLEAQISHLSDDSENYDHDRYYENNPISVNSQSRTYNTNYSKNQGSDLLYSITTSGTANEFIHLDGKKFLKSDMLAAFGGSLTPGNSLPSPYKFANPAPLGLSAFALTTFVLSLINCQARSVQVPNIVVCLAMFYGGLVQLTAGMWEIALGNVFGGTCLSSYGGFWLSFGAIYIPWFGILDAYESEIELENAVGFYLLGWTIFTAGVTLCTLKSTVAFFGLFLSLTITFLMLSVGKFVQSTSCTKAGGIFGLITALLAWYNAFAGLANKENSYIVANGIRLPQFKRD
ncbi:putative membrane protein [Wickerhamomyces ciferrii]|uniref:Membrane protein n=1 Tax=Wickerhamomyces ciferrii (strain ATCC 14091 / BCRC 22168 / CBS 111 / JCM 3599 / NBRC 0793 / NRRL Y-1031 F-60-10) TaxID=1206466 RepID=K0KF89_WICCF|nr:uncharacterized protein BN7_426 [Wickerhamomyces ciferrii]CCH40892.1 putative membrane protein [Wickerhamomyces ciferrii]